MLDLKESVKKAGPSWKTVFAVSLIALIIFGLCGKLLLSANMSLDSDAVGEGLEAMEIWNYHNYFLSGYYLPSQDTFIFTELLPFQLIPQILTGFSPLALKVTTFVEFALGVGVLTYIVYMVSQSTISALIFAALAANVPPAGYDFFALPSSHVGTVIFTGLIFALLLYMAKKEEEQMHRNRKGKLIRSSKVQWAYIGVLLVLVALTVVSDTIVLPWLIVPYILAYVLFVKNKSNTMNVAVGSMAAVSVLVYIFKTYFIYNWVAQDVFSTQAAMNFTSMVVLYVDDLTLLLNQGLNSLAEGFSGFGALEALSLLLFVALVAYAVKNALGDGKKRLIYVILLASGLTMFAMWLVSSYSTEAGSARYLIFSAYTVLMLIAIAYPGDNKVYSALILGLLCVSAVYGLIQLSQLGQPNAGEYGLITYLEENNQTFGYGGAWTSNIYTYLSGGEVTVRPVFFYTDGMEPDIWLACDRWYQSTPDRSFILIDTSSLDNNSRNVVESLTTHLNATGPLQYGQFDIYPLQGYHIGPFQVVR